MANQMLQKVKLEDVLDALIDYRGKTPKKTDFGIPLITAKIVKNGFIQKAKEFIAYSDYDAWMTRGLPMVGDVVLTTEAPLGEVAQVTDAKIALAQRIVLLRGKANILNNNWLKFYLQSAIGQNKLNERGSGTTVLGIKQSELRKMEIDLPSFSTQTLVGSILSVYDTLIQNNEKRIKILEEMAQILYTEWFVRFRFPGYERVEMTDRETEYGKVPKGWQIKKLGDKIDIKKGKNITRSTITDGIVPVVAGGLEPAYFHNTSNTKKPVVTVSASGANAGFTKLYFQDIWASDCSYIDTSISTDVYFYYLLLKNKQEEIFRLQRGSAQPHVYPKDLMDLQIINTPDPIIKSFSEIISPIFDLVGKHTAKNTALCEARDLLIQQLVTGIRKIQKEKVPIVESNIQKCLVKKDHFKDAIIFSYYVKKVTTPTFNPSAIRAEKMDYFTHRYAGVDPEEKYAVQQFGPFDYKSTYAGGKAIALKKGYIEKFKGGFRPGPNSEELTKYTYVEIDCLNKAVEDLKFQKDRDLELLSTVDYAIFDQLKKGNKPSAEWIFDYISNHPIWKGKVARLQLSVEKINKSIDFLRNLANKGLPYPMV